jgi:hypothetical protein
MPREPPVMTTRLSFKSPAEGNREEGTSCEVIIGKHLFLFLLKRFNKPQRNAYQNILDIIG